MNEQQWSRLVTGTQIASNVGVILSLLFVGLEVRQNTRFEQLSNHRELVYLVNSVSDPIIAGIEDVPALSVRADSGLARLTARERLEYLSLANRRMNIFELAFYQHREGLLDDEYWEGWDASIRGSLGARPALREFWRDNREIYGRDFAAYVDRILAEPAH